MHATRLLQPPGSADSTICCTHSLSFDAPRREQNLVQLIVLLVALTQTMIIHRLQHYQMTDIVVIFDRVFRCLIPLVLCAPLGLNP